MNVSKLHGNSPVPLLHCGATEFVRVLGILTTDMTDCAMECNLHAIHICLLFRLLLQESSAATYMESTKGQARQVEHISQNGS